MIIISTYVKPGKALEFDNAPDFLVACMRYQRTLQGLSPTSVMTNFTSLREFFQWLTVYQKTGMSPRTVQELRAVDLLGMTIEEAINVKRSDIETYLFFCTETLQNIEATRHKKLAAIRCFYNYVLDKKDDFGVSLEHNPADAVSNPKLPKRQPVYLPEMERTSLLAAVHGDNADRDYAILVLILTCGLRVSEVVNIQIQDVNFEAKTIRIRGKGNKERIARMTDACRDALQNYADVYRAEATDNDQPSAAFFVSKKTGQHITTRMIERIMQKNVNAAGIGGMGYTPHKLRHTTATILAKDGADLLVIQQILGHESPTTTQIYTHLGSEDIDKAIQKSSLTSIGSSEQK